MFRIIYLLSKMPTDQIPIGKFSFMTRLSQKALRLYDRKGLLVPEAKDPLTGYRYYTVSQLEKGVKIKILSFLGFSLEEISMLLDAESKGSYEHMEAFFRNKLEKTRFEIRQLQKIEGILQGACKNSNKILELFEMSVTEPVIKEIPEMRVVSKREIRGPYPGVEAGYNRVISFSKRKTWNLLARAGNYI